MKKAVIVSIFFCLAIIITYFITKNMKNNSSTPLTNSSEYIGKLGEVISYIENPNILIDDINIKYLGSTPWTEATNEHVALSGFDKFEVISKNGKSFQIDWSSGTGELPGLSMFKTKNGCYALNINIIEGKKLSEGVGSISGRLVLYKKFFSGKCDNEWTKDLR